MSMLDQRSGGCPAVRFILIDFRDEDGFHTEILTPDRVHTNTRLLDADFRDRKASHLRVDTR